MAFKRSAVRFRLAPPSVLRVLTSPCEHRGWQICFAFSSSVDHPFTLQKRSSFKNPASAGCGWNSIQSLPKPVHSTPPQSHSHPGLSSSKIRMVRPAKSDLHITHTAYLIRNAYLSIRPRSVLRVFSEKIARKACMAFICEHIIRRKGASHGDLFLAHSPFLSSLSV